MHTDYVLFRRSLPGLALNGNNNCIQSSEQWKTDILMRFRFQLHFRRMKIECAALRFEWQLMIPLRLLKISFEQVCKCAINSKRVSIYKYKDTMNEKWTFYYDHNHTLFRSLFLSSTANSVHRHTRTPAISAHWKRLIESLMIRKNIISPVDLFIVLCKLTYYYRSFIIYLCIYWNVQK